jgi:flagellar biosynthesis chaperone FliJ
VTRRNPGGVDPDGLLVQLDKKLEAIKSETRKANEAIQGLREVMREAKQYREELESAAQEAVDTRVSDAVATGLESFKEALDKAIEEGTQRTYGRFDELTNLLLGDTKSQKRRGEFSLTEIVEHRAGKKL